MRFQASRVVAALSVVAGRGCGACGVAVFCTSWSAACQLTGAVLPAHWVTRSAVPGVLCGTYGRCSGGHRGCWVARGRGQYDHERWMRQQVREQERQQRADMAAGKAGDRERKLEQDAAGKAEAERLTRDVGDQVEKLKTILVRGLGRRARIEWESRLLSDRVDPLDLGGRAVPLRAPKGATSSQRHQVSSARYLAGVPDTSSRSRQHGASSSN
jgi:hypothetical protein